MSEKRECGACYLCCELLDINEISADGVPFEKLAGTLCRHCSFDNSEGCCSIHASRPKSCSNYSCAWIMGFGSDDDNPLQTKVVVNPEETEAWGRMVSLVELEPGVTASFPPAMQLLEKAKGVPWVNAVCIVSSVDKPRKVYVRDTENPQLWNVKWYTSVREQEKGEVPVHDWRNEE